MRTYSILITIQKFEDRLEYLRLTRGVSEETFGGLRHLNQSFYTSKEWKDVRDYVVERDCGFDLGVIDRPIYGPIYVHHMTPITIEDLVHRNPLVLNPENLISVSHKTHNEIHYGSLPKVFEFKQRTFGDTTLW